jgi:hypothetical protein
VSGGSHLVIHIGVGSGTCHSLDALDVTELAAQVKIQATVRQSGGDCTADLRIVDRRVTLSQPLGDRLLTGCRPDGDVSASGFSTITIPRRGDCRVTLPPPRARDPVTFKGHRSATVPASPPNVRSHQALRRPRLASPMTRPSRRPHRPPYDEAGVNGSAGATRRSDGYSVSGSRKVSDHRPA